MLDLEQSAQVGMREEGDRRTRGNQREEGTVPEWENFHIGATANRDYRPLPVNAITQSIKSRRRASASGTRAHVQDDILNAKNKKD